MAHEAYRSLYGDLAKLKDDSLLADPAGGITDDNELWQLLAAMSEAVDRYCNRHFYPLTRTRYFDLDAQTPRILVPDLISITTLKDDENQDATFENTWASADYQLLPHDAAPTNHWGHPYTAIRASNLSNASHEDGFPPGQRAVEIAGTWGYRHYKELSGSLVNDATPFSATATTLAVDAGTDFAIGHTIQLETEQLLVTNIATNNLTVVRALNGTTAASHADNTPVYILRWPGPVERATLMNAARLWTRAPAFEPFYVDANLDTDVDWLLSPYRATPV